MMCTVADQQDPICVEAAPEDGGFLWVEATEMTASGPVALHWLNRRYAEGEADEPALQLVGAVWMHEIDAAVFFGQDEPAWEECPNRDSGARKFWKFAPS